MMRLILLNMLWMLSEAGQVSTQSEYIFPENQRKGFCGFSAFYVPILRVFINKLACERLPGILIS